MTSGAPTPKVFISHASEDKDRFVLDFAKRLRANGIDAWLDKWEMLPGDSLVDKIFEEGIKNASALVVVLSKASVTKPWVREELNAGFVKRLEGKCRLIPVVLEDCEIPECLRTTLWQRIERLDDYPDELKRIINAIFGIVDKPPVGPAPSHAYVPTLLSLPSLSKLDSMIFGVLCDESVRANDMFIFNMACLDVVADSGVSDEEIRDSLKMLEEEFYIEPSRVLGGGYRGSGILCVRVCTHAFEEYARVKWPNYEALMMRLVSGLVNDGWRSKGDIDKLDAPGRLRDHLVRVLEDAGHIQVSRYFGGFSIWQVSPKLKRLLTDHGGAEP